MASGETGVVVVDVSAGAGAGLVVLVVIVVVGEKEVSGEASSHKNALEKVYLFAHFPCPCLCSA